MFAKVRIIAEQAGDGALLLRSADELGDYPASVLHSLRAWADVGPGLPADRGARPGRRLAVRRLRRGGGGGGRDRAGADRARPRPGQAAAVLSGNGVSHLLMTLGALTAGVPVAPVSVAYSLQSKDHVRVRAIAELIAPGAVYADDARRVRPGA